MLGVPAPQPGTEQAWSKRHLATLQPFLPLKRLQISMPCALCDALGG